MPGKVAAMSARGALTRAFPPVIARLIPRLGSPFDHEVVATARAIERSLKSQKLDWHDVAAAVTAQPPSRPAFLAESDDAARMRSWLEAVSREPWPNDWTQKFIAGVLARPSLDRLSKKQVSCANNIVAEAYRRGVRVERSAA
jgi:hypothetical protein